MCMYWYIISYPQNNVNIIVEKNIANIFLKLIHKGESYLILHRYHIMKPNLLILKLRDNKSLLYSTLLLALDEFKKGVYRCEVSSKTVEKMLNKNVLFTISMFSNEIYSDTFVGKDILNLINEKLPLIFFYF